MAISMIKFMGEIKKVKKYAIRKNNEIKRNLKVNGCILNFTKR